MSAASEHRRFLAYKIWNGTFAGWSSPHWNLTKKDEAALSYWERNGHTERDGDLIRLTEAGRATFAAPTPVGAA